MLDIHTYDARQGGNVLYKALAHPVTAEMLRALSGRLATKGGFAVYDPEGAARMLFALYPGLAPDAGLYVHDIDRVGEEDGLGGVCLPLVELPDGNVTTLLVASFDDERMRARLAGQLPENVELITLGCARLPAEMLSVPGNYLDRLNFAVNYAFFRDEDGLSTRLVSANYWANYGARNVRLWLRLFDRSGAVIGTWEQDVPEGPGGIIIDSREVRARFDLPAFTGQLFVHAIGARGHDVVKYALDTMGVDGNRSLSVTHDANAWPSDRYGNLPAPAPGEKVVLWIQNSHAGSIARGVMTLNRMGREQHVPIDRDIGGYETVALDVASVLPDLRWPEQIEFRAGRHVVRPRYEIIADDNGGHPITRIAHLNVERGDLVPEPAIRALPESAFGRGFLLPFPILDPTRYRSIVLPAPMAHSQKTLPLRLDCFDAQGSLTASRFLGNLPRDHAVAPDLSEWVQAGGHGELIYDFRDGGEADGWLHALVRYETKDGSHSAETSFGAHIFNTLMSWRSEPQSYSGPAPGLTTRLFLKLGDGTRHSFSHLIYPVSKDWHPRSETSLILHDASGAVVGQDVIHIAASGSYLVRPHEIFSPAEMERAGVGGYVLIRDLTCRLFGYHGLDDAHGRFSLDHMFGF